MAKKKVYRAGMIPFIIEDDEIQMFFMKPSKAKYGGDVFQIAKGKMEEGEDAQETATREAQEELGLFTGNIEGDIIDLGTFLGRTTVFLCQIKDKDLFGIPHYETSETAWMTEDEFLQSGRDIHKPVIKAAIRKIKSIIDDQS